MSQKPEKLDQVWSEKELCGRLDLPVTKSGRISSRMSSSICGEGINALRLTKRYMSRYLFRGLSRASQGYFIFDPVVYY
jgi:hypothetical protein